MRGNAVLVITIVLGILDDKAGVVCYLKALHPSNQLGAGREGRRRGKEGREGGEGDGREGRVTGGREGDGREGDIQVQERSHVFPENMGPKMSCGGEGRGGEGGVVSQGREGMSAGSTRPRGPRPCARTCTWPLVTAEMQEPAAITQDISDWRRST